MPGLTRRRFGALSAAAAASLAPGLVRAMAPGALVIAEGGSAAERPEDTRSAYDLAINQGCDFIQANIFPTKDGELVARRTSELSATTDIASHAGFADRKTSKTIDGVSVTGWFVEDFTLAELRTLFCRERLPGLRPQNTKFDAKEPILSLREVLAIARAGCARTARTVGVIPRMQHVSYFSGLDLAVDQALAAILNQEGYDAHAAAIWVQAYEADALKSLGRLTRVKRVQLVDAPPADHAGSFPPMITEAGLTEINGYADAISPDQNLVIDPNAALFPAPTTLVLDAHNARLAVHTRTAAQENAFLPRLLQKGDPASPNFPAGHGDVDKLMTALFAGGADGVSTSVPEKAVRDRSRAMSLAVRRAGG
jgi:glycerophosphoryl diester phosphodiesterase